MFPNITKVLLSKEITTGMEVSISNKKVWFVLVRGIRENLGDNRTQDEFSDPRNKLKS